MPWTNSVVTGNAVTQGLGMAWADFKAMSPVCLLSFSHRNTHKYSHADKWHSWWILAFSDLCIHSLAANCRIIVQHNHLKINLFITTVRDRNIMIPSLQQFPVWTVLYNTTKGITLLSYFLNYRMTLAKREGSVNKWNHYMGVHKEKEKSEMN